MTRPEISLSPVEQMFASVDIFEFAKRMYVERLENAGVLEAAQEVLDERYQHLLAGSPQIQERLDPGAYLIGDDFGLLSLRRFICRHSFGARVEFWQPRLIVASELACEDGSLRLHEENVTIATFRGNPREFMADPKLAPHFTIDHAFLAQDIMHLVDEMRREGDLPYLNEALDGFEYPPVNFG